jgi:hypothetical protein
MHNMKTMMELLIRLQQLRDCCERTAHNPQLTAGEKAAASCLKELVRESLPADVLLHYDRLEETEPELLQCPEVFAMAVLVSTYRSLSPRQRTRLVNHFNTPPGAACGCIGHTAIRPPHLRRRGLHTTRRQLVARS